MGLAHPLLEGAVVAAARSRTPRCCTETPSPNRPSTSLPAGNLLAERNYYRVVRPRHDRVGPSGCLHGEVVEQAPGRDGLANTGPPATSRGHDELKGEQCPSAGFDHQQLADHARASKLRRGAVVDT